MMLSGVSELSNFNSLDGIGFGYIILPDNFSGKNKRNRYIQNCYRRERVSILPENGGTPIHDCIITKETLNNIEFPDETGGLGSGICFLTIKNSGKLVVIGTASKMDESGLGSENVHKVLRNSSGGHTLLIMDPNSGQIIVQNVNKEHSPTLKINLSGGSKKALFGLNVSGDVEVDVSDNINIKVRKGVNLKINDCEIDIDDKILVKNEKESLKKLVNDLFDAILQLTVTTPVGPSGVPINSPVFTQLKTRFDNLLK